MDWVSAYKCDADILQHSLVGLSKLQEGWPPKSPECMCTLGGLSALYANLGRQLPSAIGASPSSPGRKEERWWLRATRALPPAVFYPGAKPRLQLRVLTNEPLSPLLQLPRLP